MKRLPIYGLLLAGYTVIIIGIVKLYNSLIVIEVVDIHESSTTLPIFPALLLSIVVLLISLSVGGYLLSALWKYFIAHKTLIPLPILLITVGFIQFSVTLMNAFKTLISSNAELFISNLDKYIVSFQSLSMYTVIGILLILGSV